jgi:hypothetical protein
MFQTLDKIIAPFDKKKLIYGFRNCSVRSAELGKWKQGR